MRDVLEQVILAGVAAPSGDNCQPWRFVVDQKTISVYNIPDSDQSLYSWGQRPSYIAHGALLENMSIAAAHQGYRAHIDLAPEQENDLVAKVALTQDGSGPDPLYEAISRRATNRKPYRSTALSDEQRRELMLVPQEIGAGTLLLVEDAQQRADLGRIAAVNEIVLFGNQHMHSFFFGHINWNAQQDTERLTGMHIGTLELPPPARALFPVFSRFHTLQTLNRIGLSKLIAFGNGKIYATGAATGAVILDDRSPSSYIQAGRILERVWLKATSMGLELQMLTGVPLLMNRILADQAAPLSSEHVDLVSRSYDDAARILNVGQRPIAFMFRIGSAPRPAFRTQRQKPSITWN